MKSILAITALLFSLSLCNLSDRLTNRNSNEANTDISNSRSADKSNENIAPSEPVPPPPIPSNGNAQSASAGAVSGGQLNDKAISLPKPVYPPLARAAKASGPVVVEVTVDEAGKVVSASATSGHPLLRQSAVQAAYQARFRPTLISGKPVKVTGTITYNFEL